MDIVEEMRGFAEDHEPDGWPAVRMRQITALCDEIERLRSERRGPLTKHEISLVATYAPEGVTNDEVAEIVAKVELLHGVTPND